MRYRLFTPLAFAVALLAATLLAQTTSGQPAASGTPGRRLAGALVSLGMDTLAVTLSRAISAPQPPSLRAGGLGEGGNPMPPIRPSRPVSPSISDAVQLAA